LTKTATGFNCFATNDTYSGVAQPAERLAVNQRVVGSNPAAGVFLGISNIYFPFFYFPIFPFTKNREIE
jgi:hypothetical protein